MPAWSAGRREDVSWPMRSDPMEWSCGEWNRSIGSSIAPLPPPWKNGALPRTRKPSVICDQWDAVAVLFPLSESSRATRRPAVVLRARAFNGTGHAVRAMVTTHEHRAWPGDTPLSDREHAGLPRPCMLRLKLFTPDSRLILRKLGSLGPEDVEAAKEDLRSFLPWD